MIILIHFPELTFDSLQLLIDVNSLIIPIVDLFLIFLFLIILFPVKPVLMLLIYFAQEELINLITYPLFQYSNY